MGPLSVLASDGQGTVSTALDSAGNVTSAQLFTPYGVSRYSSGSSPTAHGYAGQLADGSTGLDYYNARYYDPLAQQFTSADTVLPGDGMDVWGLSRYAYVEGNPLIRVDPTGHDGGWLGGLVSAVTATVSTAVSTVISVAHTPGTTYAGSTTQAKQTLRRCCSMSAALPATDLEQARQMA